MPNQLNNYLRTHRRRAGLTQRDVAFLLGLKARGPVSELEKHHRVPLLRTALALEIIFGVSAGELFAGMRESIATEMQARLETLSSELVPKVANKRDAYQTRRKLAWLAERHFSSDLYHQHADWTKSGSVKCGQSVDQTREIEHGCLAF